MASPDLTPFINGQQYDFGSITVKVTLPSGTQKTYFYPDFLEGEAGFLNPAIFQV